MLDLLELYSCVHCGLCLNHCPTYRLLQLETESPRGRIHLVRAAAEGRIDLNDRVAEHLYLCLMCRACETACPSGVKFGRIAEAAREALGPRGPDQAIVKFALKRLLPFPGRLRWAARLLRLYQRARAGLIFPPILPARLQAAEALLPEIPGRFFEPRGEVLPAAEPRRARVGMLTGCVMGLFLPHVNDATVRVLRLNGCEVVLPKEQVCCGALNIHNGDSETAKSLARRNIEAFLEARVDAVVVNASGCGAAMKEYAHLLRDDPRYLAEALAFSKLVKDASEFLFELGLRPPARRVEVVVTYQDPCHLAHGQRIRAQPRALLKAVEGLRLVEMAGSDRCCGGAGIYNLTQFEMSRALLSEKMASIAATSAEAVVAPNPGCMLQLSYGARTYGPQLQVFHLMDLLSRAYP